MGQEAKTRKDQIRDRVDELKRTKREVKELYPVPLHIHVGVQPNPDNDVKMGPNESLFSVYSTKGVRGGNVRPTRSPLTRLAERKILTKVVRCDTPKSEKRG